MRIQKLHISGFKSFADRLDLEFRHRLTGIVGPNGCGKSNLFEAVRWAMGESSSKNLRAESGADIICNGSGKRKPAARAEVELVFDNSDGRIGGKAGSWNEISVRRTIDRESESHYYLNGNRCRKRDITALFSGTGFGPRSYSIIEQGMISRIIEAKPQDLRAHLEEAAGISAYRNSRKETESRMRSTRNNLERILLVVAEVERQMKSLHRQAQQTERYHKLSAEEKLLQSQVLALAWQEHGEKNAELQKQNSVLNTELEKGRSELQGMDTSMERLRLQLQGTEQECDSAQQQFHELSTSVSVQEKECQHSRQQQEDLRQEQQNLSARMQQEQQQLEQDDKQIRQLEQEAAEVNATLLKLREKTSATDSACTKSEQDFEQCQQRLARAKDAVAELHRERDSGQGKLENLQGLLAQAIGRHQEIEDELKLSEDTGHSDQLQSQRQQLQQMQQQCGQAKEAVQRQVTHLQELREQAAQVDGDLAAAREKLRHLHGELSSLTALQNEALKNGADEDRLGNNSKLQQAPRLGERLQADNRWHLAVETVLNKHLQDLELQQLDDLLDCGSDGGAFGAYRAGLSADATGTVDTATAPHPGLLALAGQIKSPVLPADFLGGIWAADSLDIALAARANLAEGHSVITVDGVWLGRDWIRIGQPREAGTLDRAAELKNISAEHGQAQQQCSQLEQSLAEKREQQRQGEIELQGMREKLQSLQDNLAKQQGEVAVGEVRAADLLEKINNLSSAITENSEQQNQLRREIDELNSSIRLTTDKIEAGNQHIAGCQDDCANIREKMERDRAARDQAREELHQAALRHEAANSKLESLRQSLQRQEENHRREQTRLVELSAQMDKVNQKVPEQQQKLQALLTEHKLAEQQLQKKQTELQQARGIIERQEQKHKAIATQLQQQQDSLQQNDIKIAELATEQRILSEQIGKLGETPEHIVESIDGDSGLPQLQEQLDRVQQKLGNLGPINPAAIDEQRELGERKQYLDQQREDLEHALATLQTAIRKIDSESRKRFNETFNQVNANLQETFARLFGGGTAQLELLEEDGDADPGVIIRARPPGKRGGLISILSGGEKTLVALALIFSIFMLNPSPVCFLDEVDAPLDDVNVGRFINMVRAMSEQLQFIFITHNKLSMEMAEVLLGVTMREAGVSKLVSVDTKEAISLVG